MIYFDNAATTSPKPQSVVAAVNNALLKYSANPGRGGHEMSMECAQMVHEARIKTAKLFNAESPSSIVFTSSCTAALNTAISGLFSNGDHVIISSLEHNAVSRTVEALTEDGVSYDIAIVDIDDAKTVANFMKLIKPTTKAIVCIHASNVFGLKLPIDKLGELCEKHGLYFIVDAAQTAGVINIDVQKFKIDYLCIAPHKGLYAPMGLGILITDTKPRPLVFGGTGSESILQTQPEYTPDKYESGTINVPAIAGLSAGIDFIGKKIKDVYEHEMGIIRYIYSQLKRNKKIKLYTDYPNDKYVPLLSFNAVGFDSAETASLLNKMGIAVRAGLHCAPLAHRQFGTIETGTVRIAPSAFSTTSDAERIVYCIDKICDKRGD